MWVHYFLEIADSLQQGLHNANKSAPPGSQTTFQGLSGNEACVIHKIGCILENLDDFFEFSADNDCDCLHCLCCVFSACLPLPTGSPALLNAINLTIAHNSEAYRTTLLNDMVCQVKDEAEAWASEAQTKLHKYMI